MSTKSHRWAGNELVITIHDGEAAGEYRKHRPYPAEIKADDGKLFLAWIGERRLKVLVSDFPGLMAEIEAVYGAWEARQREAAQTDDSVDAKMRQAGFEASGNAGDAYNRLRPVRGEDF